MYTINNIAFETYGLYISSNTGLSHIPEMKDQLFTVYGKEGYQISRRKPNELNLNGFIIADDITDFTTKCNNLRAVFSSSGTKAIQLRNATFNYFAKDGFTISNVKVAGRVFAKFTIKLTKV